MMTKQRTSVTKALPEDGISQLMGAPLLSMLLGSCVLLTLQGSQAEQVKVEQGLCLMHSAS